MNELSVICPNCKAEMTLTESIAAPLLAKTQREVEKQLRLKDAEIETRERNLKEKEREIKDAQKKIELQVNEQVASKMAELRTQWIEEETRRSKLKSSFELECKVRELDELRETLKIREEKLVSAQKKEAEFMKFQRELDDSKRELELTIERRVQLSLEEVKKKAAREMEEGAKLKLMEKDQTISSMQKKIEELSQKARQGSEQLQGEVQELELEAMLRYKFPTDAISPVPKGEFGGDVLQRVWGPGGQDCGTILWESKRTKHWSESWLAKLREDQRAAKAELAVLVSQSLPSSVETFDIVQGVWVTSLRAALPVAVVLRQGLLQLSAAKNISKGRLNKTEVVYEYLTGSRFRQNMETMVEAFSTMQEDLHKERRAILKQWAKREEQIDRVISATTSMYGDLQGILGKPLQEIEALEWKALESKESKENKESKT